MSANSESDFNQRFNTWITNRPITRESPPAYRKMYANGRATMEPSHYHDEMPNKTCWLLVSCIPAVLSIAAIVVSITCKLVY